MADTDLHARCACGDLLIELSHISEKRFLCCCTDCQKRTGASYGVSWYYQSRDVRLVSGSFSTFDRTGTKGTLYHFHHCTKCGSTVHWTVDGSDSVGIASGCIPAALQLKPVRAVWVGSRADWVHIPRDIPWHSEGTSSPLVHDPADYPY